MEFDIEKGAMLIRKSEKRQITDGIELPNQERNNTRRKGKLQVLKNIGSRHHQTRGDEGKNKKLLKTNG